jgi:TonB family protein
MRHIWFIGSMGLMAAAVLFAPISHAADDVPAAFRFFSCRPIEFDSKGVVLPAMVDTLVEVDEEGKPGAVSFREPITVPGLEAAMIKRAKSCGYFPARSRGKAAPGHARVMFPISQAEDQSPGATPTVGDVSECAPKDYPEKSRRRGSEGTTRVRFTVDDKGGLKSFGVERSSGDLLLDYTALIKLSDCKFTPGKAADGTPIGGTFTVDYQWKLQ